MHSLLTDAGSHVQIAQFRRRPVLRNHQLLLFDQTVELLGLGFTRPELLLDLANEPECSVEVLGGGSVQLGAEGCLLDEVAAAVSAFGEASGIIATHGGAGNEKVQPQVGVIALD